MLKYIFIILMNSVRSTARLFGYELKIVFTENKIKTYFENPETQSLAWDDSHWVHGNVFFRDYANPIKVTKEFVTEDELITSDRYKSFMEQKLLDDMLQVNKSGGLTLAQATLAIVTLQLLNLAVMYVLVNGGI